MNERGSAVLSVLETIGVIALVAVLCIGGWFLYWGLTASSVNRVAKINRTSYEVQQTYREKALDDIAEVNRINTQLASPDYAGDIGPLNAQRVAVVHQTCDAISRLTTSGAGVDPDIQAFHDKECIS